MKRFYCTVCKKVKRVRKLPRELEADSAWQYKSGTNGEIKVGVCNRHAFIGNQKSVMSRRKRA